jgi:hypothetical protein
MQRMLQPCLVPPLCCFLSPLLQLLLSNQPRQPLPINQLVLQQPAVEHPQPTQVGGVFAAVLLDVAVCYKLACRTS